jgi:hypothetical protein
MNRWLRDMLSWFGRNLSYWLREAAGWALVALGLHLFQLTYEFGRQHLFLEMWPLAIIGIFVFRGGIHLLKVAIAARICMEAQNRLYPAVPPGVQSRVQSRPAAARRG